MLFSRGPCTLKPPFLPSPTPLTYMHTFIVYIKNTFFQYKTFKNSEENVDDVRHVQSIVQPVSLMWQAVCLSYETVCLHGNIILPGPWVQTFESIQSTEVALLNRQHVTCAWSLWASILKMKMGTGCNKFLFTHPKTLWVLLFRISYHSICERQKRMGTWTGVVVYVVYSTCIGQNIDSKTQILGNCPE